MLNLEYSRLLHVGSCSRGTIESWMVNLEYSRLDFEGWCTMESWFIECCIMMLKTRQDWILNVESGMLTIVFRMLKYNWILKYSRLDWIAHFALRLNLDFWIMMLQARHDDVEDAARLNLEWILRVESCRPGATPCTCIIQQSTAPQRQLVNLQSGNNMQATSVPDTEAIFKDNHSRQPFQKQDSNNGSKTTWCTIPEARFKDNHSGKQF